MELQKTLERAPEIIGWQNQLTHLTKQLESLQNNSADGKVKFEESKK